MIRARLQPLEVPHRKILNKTNYNPAALFLAQIILVIWAIRYGLTKSNILLNMIFEENRSEWILLPTKGRYALLVGS